MSVVTLRKDKPNAIFPYFTLKMLSGANSICLHPIGNLHKTF